MVEVQLAMQVQEAQVQEAQVQEAQVQEVQASSHHQYLYTLQVTRMYPSDSYHYHYNPPHCQRLNSANNKA